MQPTTDPVQDPAHHLVDLLRRLINANLTSAEQTHLNAQLTDAYGPEPYSVDQASRTALWTTIESELTAMYNTRFQTSTDPTTLSLSALSVLKPLYVTQHLLEQHAAAHTTLDSLVQRGAAEFGSMAAFLADRAEPAYSNLWFGYQYYCSLVYERRQFVEAEAVLRPWIPLMEGQPRPGTPVLRGGSDPRVLGAVRALITALEGQGRFDEAQEMIAECWRRVHEMVDEDIQHQADEVEELQRVADGVMRTRAEAGRAVVV